MEVDQAIISRVSVKKFTDQAVPEEWIERCLDWAVWAPNHRLTEPWRFHVIIGDGRKSFADVVTGQLTLDPMATGRKFGSVGLRVAQERVRTKIMSAPALIVVYSLRADDESITRENFAATAASVQNILLGAWHMGLATIWRTDEFYAGSQVRAHLQVPPEADFIAAIHLGFSAQRETTRRRTPAREWTTWLKD